MTSLRKSPWWLWPNLLSLDAPLVAVAWLFMIAQAWRNKVPADIYFSLIAAVWLIYVVDRILDVWKAGRENSEERLEKRHYFHYQYRGWFLLGVLLAGLFLLRMVLFVLPEQLLFSSLLPIVMTGSYFLVSWSLKRRSKAAADGIAYGKNFLAGLTFALGTAAGAFAFSEEVQGFMFIFSSEILCFGLLCVLNITAIDVWQELRATEDPDQNVLLEASLTLPLTLLALFSLWQMISTSGGEQLLFGALFVSSAALQMLHRARARFSEDTMRVLADFALILPAPIFFLS